MKFARFLICVVMALPLSAQTPFSLSDPDGQELVLEELDAHAAIHGMLSLTELELRFRNPKALRIEGRFNCVLPPNAAISRFAKEIDGHLMEGEVVERLRANQVYEQFLHVMRDPALLEQDQGNRFSARIFPIEANGSVRILISYSALLPLQNGVRAYTLPLRGLPKVNKLTFHALVQPLPGESSIVSNDSMTHTTADVITYEKRDIVPDRDINLTWRPSADAPRRNVLRAGDFFLTSLRPELSPATVAVPHAWLLFVDTSASAAEGAAHRIKALQVMLAAMPAEDTVRVEAFDQDLVTLGSGTTAEMSHGIDSLLRSRLFLGGTDLAALIRHAGDEAKAHPDHGVIIASDFVATLGATERHDVEEAARAIPPNTTLRALILGSREDSAIARTLTAGRGRIIRVPFSDAMESRARDAAADLWRPLGKPFDITETKAEWLYPTHFDDVQNGDELIVIGKLKAGNEPDGAVAMPAALAPLLEREAWRANLDFLADREAAEASESVRRALAAEEVKLSVEHRVVIPRTTMLVLESEGDYQRFGLDRRALASILTVAGGGIEQLDRKTDAPPEMWTPEAEITVVTKSGDAAERQQPSTVTLRAEGRYAVDFTSGWISLNGAPPPPAPPPVPMHGEPSDEKRAAAIVINGAPAYDDLYLIPNDNAAPPSAAARSQQERRSDADWSKRVLPTKAEISDLQAKLKEHPDDRELYNQLSEALAALGDWNALRRLALAWQPYDPENPQVYEVLGLADEHLGNMTEAARANASIIEIAPAKPELLQRAGLLLLRDGRGALAEAPLRHALEIRPDRVNGYRHLALLLWQQGRPEEAARVLESATRQNFPQWYGDAKRVVREELGYVYRAWLAKDASKKHEIEDRAREHDVDLARRDALRVTLAWETDANDVDLHVVDPKGEECYYSHKDTATGLSLYEDITRGLGPEVIRTDKLVDGTYRIGVRYFSAGPMGVSRGIVIIMRGDDTIDIEPFRLVEGGGEIRYVTSVEARPAKHPSRARADRSRS